MKSTVLAKRYAKALFAVGKEEGAGEQYGAALNSMAELYGSMPEVADALTNPVYPLEVREKVMAHLVQSLGATAVMANFFTLLVQKKRAAILPELAEVYQSLVDADKNLVRGTVVSATPLPADLNARVQATLEKITGKQVVLTTAIDPAVIGGMVAKVGDLVLDGSIRSQLAGLKESIKGSN